MIWTAPELLLLALPALALAWWTRWPTRRVQGLRIAVVLLLVLAAAGPLLRTSPPGTDAIVVVDRSASMPAAGLEEARTLLRLAADARGAGDRLGLVAFGDAPVVVQPPTEDADGLDPGELSGAMAEGSDIAAALESALALIPEGRAGHLLLVSDGEADGGDPVAVAALACARGIAIDVRPVTRPPRADVAVDVLSLPEVVDAGTPFQFSAWVVSDAARQVPYTLLRDGATARQGTLDLRAGRQQILLRDGISQPGIASYTLRLEGLDDRVPENNEARGVVRAVGARGVLLYTADGADGPLGAALRGAGVPLRVASPATLPPTATGLDAFQAVLLADVPADALGASGMAALGDLVTERGGGLAMTGGRASYGLGGYYASPLDPLLPVSMEMRTEQRKMGLALSIALDRSGSMAAPVNGGLTKMDLADQGAAEAIRLLGPMDHVTVMAVDTAAHVVQPLAPATDTAGMRSRVLRIQSEGGGIYVHTALVAAAKQLEGAPQKNRHIVLFSDAADSEEQEGAVALARKLSAAGVSLSVIALGSRFDSDARFLEELARAGGTEAKFTLRPEELPRIFAQDTLEHAKASFVEEATGLTLGPELLSLGGTAPRTLPRLGGYNLTWLRPGASLAIRTTDDNKAPVLAFWWRGAGRVAAHTAQVGGTFGPEVARWPELGSQMATLARWLIGPDDPGDASARARIEGREARITVDLAPGVVAPASAVARLRASDGTVREVTLARDGPDRLSGVVRMDARGVWTGAVHLGQDRVLTLPPLTLPYAPEFAPVADPDRGARLLRHIATASGGAVGAGVGGLYSGTPGPGAGRPLAPWLLTLAAALWVAEIAVRRLGLGGTRPPAPPEARTPAPGPRPSGVAVDPALPPGPTAPAPSQPAAPADPADSPLARAREKAHRELKR